MTRFSSLTHKNETLKRRMVFFYLNHVFTSEPVGRYTRLLLLLLLDWYSARVTRERERVAGVIFSSCTSVASFFSSLVCAFMKRETGNERRAHWWLHSSKRIASRCNKQPLGWPPSQSLSCPSNLVAESYSLDEILRVIITQSLLTTKKHNNFDVCFVD